MRWVAVVLFIVGLSPASFGQCPQLGLPTVPRIQGEVVDPDGNPIEGIIVEVFYMNPDGSAGKLFAATKTDKQGQFRIRKRKETDFLIKLQTKDKAYKLVRVRIGSRLLERSEGFNSLLVTLGVHPDCPEVIVKPR